ncbi:MAG: transglutaminase-like domain-containing protein [Luteolibacter sp.]
MPAVPASEEASSLLPLLRLLDDETPEVRSQVASRVAGFGGDLSELLASLPYELSPKEKSILQDMLSHPRREQLRKEWIVPSDGAAGLQEDWETFEALLRVLSDFLHDGITLRQSLSDALDFLAEEAEEEGVRDEDELRAFLFESGRLSGNREDYYDPRNSDLAWCLAEGKSNPIGLCLIYILLARRLGLDVEGVQFPGHFLCRIHIDGTPWIVDCFDQGQKHEQNELLENRDQLDKSQRAHLKLTAGPGLILHRILNNLEQALGRIGQTEDVALILQLQQTLKNS